MSKDEDDNYHADIHHFDSNYKGKLIDDDGDILSGWYFQIIKNEKEPVTELIGPYMDKHQCEDAAIVAHSNF